MLDSGRKRTLQDMISSDYSNNAKVNERMEQDDFIPWRIFRRRALLDGTTSAQAAYDFVQTIQNNRVACEFNRGKWNAPECQGIRRTSGRRQEQGIGVVRNGQFEPAEELRDLSLQGPQIVERQAAFFDGRGAWR